MRNSDIQIDYSQFDENEKKMERSSSVQFKEDIEDKFKNISEIVLFQNLKKKLIDINEIDQSPRTQKQRDLYKKLSFPRRICFFVLLIIRFFEKPVWCYENQYTDNCQYPLDDPNNFIPNSNIYHLNKYVFNITEIGLLSFLAFNKHLKYSFMTKSKKRDQILILIWSLVIICSLDDILQFFNFYKVNLSMLICPIFFVAYHGRLRQIFVTYCKIMLYGLPLLFLMIFNIFMFSGLGKVFFYNVENDNMFNDFWQASFELLVLQTTSNFPDVMMPYYIQYRWAPIFFCAFLIINYILLTNYLLGVFYMYYKQEISSDTKNFYLKNKDIHEIVQKLIQHDEDLQSEPKYSIQDEFLIGSDAKELQFYNSNLISNAKSEQAQKISKQKSNYDHYYNYQSYNNSGKKNEFYTEDDESEENKDKNDSSLAQENDPSYELKQSLIIEEVDNIPTNRVRKRNVNYKKQNATSEQKPNRFSQQYNYNQQQYFPNQSDYFKNFNNQNGNESSLNSSMIKKYSANDILKIASKKLGVQKNQKKEKKIVKADNKVKRWIRNVFFNDYFDLLMGVLCMINFWILYLDTKNNSTIQIVFILSFCVNVLNLLELVFRLYLLGLEKFSKKYFYVFEGLISFLLTIFLIIYTQLSNGSPKTVLLSICELIITIKIVRFLKLMKRFEKINMIFASLYDFLPYFIDIIAVLLIFFFIFAAIGQHLFGGHYNTYNQYKVNPTNYQGFVVPEYIYNNFNDLPNGFLLLFEIMMVNNWMINTEVGCSIMGSSYYRLFFIIWYIFSVILSFSILVAFIIDHLVNIWEKQQIEEQEKLKISRKKTLKENFVLQNEQQKLRNQNQKLKDELRQQQDLEQKLINQQNKIQNALKSHEINLQQFRQMQDEYESIMSSNKQSFRADDYFNYEILNTPNNRNQSVDIGQVQHKKQNINQGAKLENSKNRQKLYTFSSLEQADKNYQNQTQQQNYSNIEQQRQQQNQFFINLNDDGRDNFKEENKQKSQLSNQNVSQPSFNIQDQDLSLVSDQQKNSLEDSKNK